MMVTTPQAKVRPSNGVIPQIADEELLKRSSETNDYHAFEQIFHRYYSILCEQAYHLVHCEHCSKEIVSDVFLKIFSGPSATRNGPEQPRTTVLDVLGRSGVLWVVLGCQNSRKK